MSGSWEILEYVGEALVFLGVVGEVVTERKLLLKDDELRRDALEGLASWVLIFGLAISLTALVGTNESFNSTIATLNKQAANSNERAAELRLRSDELEEKLQEQGPRSALLYGKREADFLNSIGNFRGQKVQVRTCKFGDNEIRDTAERLTTLLRNAGWTVSPNSPDWGESNCLFVGPNEPIPSGIWVGTPNARPTPQTQARAEELVRLLSRIPLAATRHRVGAETARANASRTSIDEKYGDADGIVVTILEHPQMDASVDSVPMTAVPSAASENSTPPSSGSGKEQIGEHVMPAWSAPLVSLFGAVIAMIYYYKNLKLSRSIADRTVTIEAQKLLLEINKQFVSDPTLLAVYDDYSGRDELLKSKPELLEKIKALGYMNLNVFEIVFAVLPEGIANDTWVAYFRDSLSRCSVIQEELKINPKIYHRNLLIQYEAWTQSQNLATKSIADESKASGV